MIARQDWVDARLNVFDASLEHLFHYRNQYSSEQISHSQQIWITGNSFQRWYPMNDCCDGPAGQACTAKASWLGSG